MGDSSTPTRRTAAEDRARFDRWREGVEWTHSNFVVLPGEFVGPVPADEHRDAERAVVEMVPALFAEIDRLRAAVSSPPVQPMEEQPAPGFDEYAAGWNACLEAVSQTVPVRFMAGTGPGSSPPADVIERAAERIEADWEVVSETVHPHDDAPYQAIYIEATPLEVARSVIDLLADAGLLAGSSPQREAAPAHHRYTQFQTVDAIDKTTVEAIAANEGWEFLHSGMGAHGQTTLTFGWPAAVGVSDEQ